MEQTGTASSKHCGGLIHPLALELEAASLQFEAGDFQSAYGALEQFNGRLAELSTVTIHGKRIADPKASVIVVSYRHSPKVESGLEELARQTRKDEQEIILVDTGNKEFFDAASLRIRNFVAVQPPFPAGASGGRNVGAHFARAPRLIFLDDDGVMDAGCIDALMQCLDETDAVGARGRVRPLTSPKLTAPHYDLGERRFPHLVNCEGVSIWRRREFMAAGGFSPLLYGHEGIELCGRIWRFHGPGSFVYEPSAVLLHDYAANDAAAATKKDRYERNRRYVETISPGAYPIHAEAQRASSNSRMLHLTSNVLNRPPDVGPCAEPVSVITTARNAAEWLAEYSRSWMTQTQTNFQLVFVDDGSGDGTAERLKELWPDDERLTLVQKPFGGRGESLNVAIRHALHDICLIADVDDLSVPSRIARTQNFFKCNPDLDCVSFLAFMEKDHYLAGRPHSPHLDDVEIRSLFGMPFSFPTFAFRKSQFPMHFDEEMRGGIDCDWVKRNYEAKGCLRGRFIHFPLVYYRQHAGQISNLYRAPQNKSGQALVRHSFSRVLGNLSETDHRFISMLIETRQATAFEKKRLGDWLSNFLQLNNHKNAYQSPVLARAMGYAYDAIEVKAALVPASTKSVEEVVGELRRRSEVHISAGDFQEARRALRKALELRPEDRTIRSRLRSAHRWRLIRKLFKSEPYKP